MNVMSAMKCIYALVTLNNRNDTERFLLYDVLSFAILKLGFETRRRRKIYREGKEERGEEEERERDTQNSTRPGVAVSQDMYITSKVTPSTIIELL